MKTWIRVNYFFAFVDNLSAMTSDALTSDLRPVPSEALTFDAPWHGVVIRSRLTSLARHSPERVEGAKAADAPTSDL
jgi:hypothetical protein